MDFRLNPNNARSIDEVIADLTQGIAQLTPDHPRAIRVAEMILGLREFLGDRADPVDLAVGQRA